MRQVKMTRDSFHVFQANARNALKQSEQVPSILICAGTGCIAGGAMKIYDNLKTECEKRGLPVYVGLKHDTDAEKSLHVKMSGCHGFCEMGPLVHIEPMGVMYIHVKPEDCHEILEKTVLGGEIIDRLVYHLDGVAYPRQEDIPFYKKQHRVVLENCGSSDAEDIEEYIAKGGYAGFEKALFEMTDEEICRSIIDSGLRGRGGGGFPAGQKWDGARKQKSEKKYIVCNGDEGDPGAFMDRSIMEGNPHSVLEGMMIAGRRRGQRTKGYILCPGGVSAGREPAEGGHCQGGGSTVFWAITSWAQTSPSRIQCKPWAPGAFVCGGGQWPMTAFHRGATGGHASGQAAPDHRARSLGRAHGAEQCGDFCQRAPHHPQGRGLVPLHRHQDQPRHQGLRAGQANVVNTGLIEVPMGTTIREVVFDIGGGIRGGKKFKAFRSAAPPAAPPPPAASTWTCPGLRQSEEHRRHDRLRRLGGHGRGHLHGGDGPVLHGVYTEGVLRQVRPLPEGTKRMLEILDRIIDNKGTLEDLDLLEELADTISKTACAAWGRAPASPSKAR